MIEGKVKTYREIDALNQSMLKVWDDNPVQFYKEFILKEKRDNKDTWSTVVGSLTDFILLDCRGSEETYLQRVDDHFVKFDGVKSSAQAYLLADELFAITLRDTEDGVVKTDFDTRFSEALQNVQKMDKYKGKTVEKALEDFEKVAGEYFGKLIENIGKIVVDESMLVTAERLAKDLISDPFTSDYYNSVHEDLRKHTIEFNFLGQNCKAEIDQILIDHHNKVIQPIDLKCTFDNENFAYSYLKRGYYLQNAFYNVAIVDWMYTQDIEDYHVNPMVFVVADTSKAKRRPICYHTTEQHLKQGMHGFENNGYYYKGVKELIEEIAWAQETGNWNVSKDVWENNGKMVLKDFK